MSPTPAIPSAETFRAALDEAAIVAVTDRAGRIIECNERFCLISGYSREELIGRTHRIVNSGHHDRDFFRQMYAEISQGRVWKGTICNRRKTGELYWVDTTIYPNRDAEGQINAYISLRFEVTSHVAALTALEAATEEAMRAASAKDQFLANMSHEVRTPLNGIIGLAAALGASDLDPKQREMIELILRSGESLRRILDDVLDIAKADAGALAIERRAIDLREELQAAAELMRIRAEEKGLRFEVAFGEGADGWVMADPARLRQILSNLISNAIKFTDVGEVRVQVAVREAGEGWRLTIDVIDTGIGFDEAQAEKLFDRFVQADGSSARRHGGAGLGLAISRTLAELMGGTLEARSEPGLGSVFRLVLPVETVARPAPPAEAAGWALWVDDVPPRVLLAEDHPTNQLVVRALLEPLGATVEVAANGAQAVDRAERDAYDVILMDMQMPVMDGLAAVAAIREREQRLGLPRVPIAMLTANTSGAHRKAADEHGADGFIAKPLTLDTLVGGINEVLASRARQPAGPGRSGLRRAGPRRR